jgi:predicted transcriptional regulator
VAGMIYSERATGDPGKDGIGIKVATYSGEQVPEITEAAAANPLAATSKFTRLVMEQVRSAGGRVPEEAVREVVENLIHAGYRGVVISVFDEGNTVRVSDKGPGIEHKERVFEFGFSGATSEALSKIRGVGAGLGIARAEAAKAGGTVTVEDNIGGGTVATISVPADEAAGDAPQGALPVVGPARKKYPGAVPKMNISERQQKVLITVLECGEVGPSTVAESLEMSVSTAYRDLSVLEEHGLITAEESGKRVVSPLGKDYVEAIVGTWVK